MKLMEPVISAEEAAQEVPLEETFRADDLYGLIDEILDELSGMGVGGGKIQGAATSSTGKGPWPDLDAEEENEEQEKDQRLKGEKALIQEVANYLLNAGV